MGRLHVSGKDGKQLLLNFCSYWNIGIYLKKTMLLKGKEKKNFV